MPTEIEAKWLDVNPDKLRAQLKSLGAILVYPEIIMRRKTFDFADNRLQKIGGWVRVRDEGGKVTLSYKQLHDRTLHGTQEVTVIVSDFDQTCQILQNIGLQQKAYQETKREAWRLGTVEVTIDTWPWIPTFVELEADSESELKNAARRLQLNWTQAMHGSVETVYQRHYDFTEDEIDLWSEIRFIPEPDWLLARKKS